MLDTAAATWLTRDMEATTATVSPIAERLAALRPFVTNGPAYNRGVAECYADAVRMDTTGRDFDADWWTTMAEREAGIISFEEFAAYKAGLSGQLF